MSGIGGILHRDLSPVAPVHLSAMLDRLERRGPDGSAFWQHGPVGLVHTLLWSTPESFLEQQPLASSSGDLMIVMDGRLDNRATLIPRLELRDRSEREITDTQIVLTAYQQWGVNCLPALIGDFAFAIWDPALNRFFCARDVFGIRPFYYFCDNQRFAFASEIKVLLALPFVGAELNESAVSDYMLELFDHKARTFYAHIFRLPPACTLQVTPDEIRVQPYWALDPRNEIRLNDSREYAEAYRDLFIEAVRARLRSAFPVGSALSGGLDSSSISCVSGKLLSEQGQQIDTFSAIFDLVPESDEWPFMQIVLDQGYYRPHFIRGDLASPLGNLETFLAEQDQPFYAPHLFLDYQLWKAASQAGDRVFLEGLFGDNVVSHGFAWLNELARTWRWLELYRQIRLLADNHPNPAPVSKLMARYFLQNGIKDNLPEKVLAVYRHLRGRPPSAPVVLPAILNPDYARQVDISGRLEMAAQESRFANTARKAHLLELNSGLIPTALEIYSAGSATFSLDVRFTYLDRRLAEFCLAVPANQKLDNGYSRMIARRGLEGYLPDQIRWRSGKGDISHNLVYGLKKEQGKLNDLLLSSGRSLQGYLNMPVLERWAQRVSAGQGTDEQVLSVYLAAILACWFSTRDGAQNGAEGGGSRPRTKITDT